jgi:hypothetical protein
MNSFFIPVQSDRTGLFRKAHNLSYLLAMFSPRLLALSAALPVNSANYVASHDERIIKHELFQPLQVPKFLPQSQANITCHRDKRK